MYNFQKIMVRYEEITKSNSQGRQKVAMKTALDWPKYKTKQKRFSK